MMNFLRHASRALFSRKSFSILNVVGLTVGIAASLLIFLVIKNEMTYDNFHKNRKNIYRVVSVGINKSNGEVAGTSGSVPSPLPAAMKQDFPQLEKVTSLWYINTAQLYAPNKDPRIEERRFKESGGLFWIEPSLFEIFDYSWVAGNAKRLEEVNTCVLAESLAKKFYGDAQSAIGNTLQMYSFRIPFQVVGVFKDQPSNTDMPLRYGASFATFKKIAAGAFTDPDAWNYNNGSCFVLLGKNQSISTVNAQLPAFVKKYYKPDPLVDRRPILQPLKEMHQDLRFDRFNVGSLSKTELWSLALIGIFLLAVACINFINLATAQSVNRAKEIGVRKVLGGSRRQLIGQFLTETAMVTLVSLLAGCLLAMLTLPMLNKLMDKNLSMNLLSDPTILLYLLIAGLVITFLAGFYPAMVLSGFQPATVFKYKVRTKAGGLYLRRGLVVFQFVIAQLLIIGTVVVVKQMRYFQDKKLGLDKDGIVLINLPSDSTLRLQYPMLKARMENVPGVTSAAYCMEAPSVNWSYDQPFYYNNESQKKDWVVTRQFGDTGYYRTFGMQLIAGRLPFASDTTRELVGNEMLAKKLGLKTPQELIGQMITFGDEGRKYPIVGVVKDYNNKSLREQISPILISSQAPTYEWLAVRMARQDMSKTLASVRKLFTGIYPTYIYDQYFFDERLEQFYANEATTSKLFKIFSILAIMISCLGLYGLVSFMAVQKTKEVGIRKVLGASVKSIVYLFSKEFTLLIGVAFVIATPIGFYFMQKWLSGFYFHTSLGVEVFVLALLFSIVIAWITVGYKAIKAALANPTKSLKTE